MSAELLLIGSQGPIPVVTGAARTGCLLRFEKFYDYFTAKMDHAGDSSMQYEVNQALRCQYPFPYRLTGCPAAAAATSLNNVPLSHRR